MAEIQRREELKQEFGDERAPLFREVRELILRKVHADKEAHVRAIFEQQPFGELERLVTQRLLDVLATVAKEELANDSWLQPGGGAEWPKLRGNPGHRPRLPRYRHFPLVSETTATRSWIP